MQQWSVQVLLLPPAEQPELLPLLPVLQLLLLVPMRCRPHTEVDLCGMTRPLVHLLAGVYLAGMCQMSLLSTCHLLLLSSLPPTQQLPPPTLLRRSVCSCGAYSAASPSFSGLSMLAATPPPSTAATMINDTSVAMWKSNTSASILAPMKPSTTATALSR